MLTAHDWLVGFYELIRSEFNKVGNFYCQWFYFFIHHQTFKDNYELCLECVLLEKDTFSNENPVGNRYKHGGVIS